MSRWGSRSVALLSVVVAFATSGFAQAQDIHVVDVPLVTDAQIQFFRLPWPSTRIPVRRVVQDNHGFLWLSAADGLRRYDGYGLMRVPDSHDPKSLGFVIAESLARDRAGRIWIGADDSLGLYDPATGTFKQHRSPDKACGTVAVAHDITEDQDGLVWLATDDGITALDPVTSKTTCYRPRDSPSIGERRVIATLPSRDGTLWITSSAGLYALDRRSGKVTRHIRLETSSGRTFRCTGFPAKPFQDSTGMIWVGLRSGGDLASVNPAGGEITVYSFQGAGFGPDPSSGVVSIQEDQDRALWLGTNKLGLVKLTPDRKQAVWYQSNPEDPNGLGGDLVVELLRDRDGSMWSTTKAGDVYRFQSQRPVFRSYRHQRGNPHSLDEGSVTAAYVEDRDTLWIGTDRGLNRVDRRTDHVTRYDEPVFRRGVRAIAKDDRGTLWVGTRGNGLVRFDPRSGRYKIYAHVESDPRSLSYDNIDALWIDRRGTLWVATDFGLNRFDPATEEFRRYSPQPKSLTQYRSIAEDAGGVLWLGTASQGLHRFDPGTGTFTIVDQRLRDPRRLGHNRVNSVHMDRSGTVWAATFGGLHRFDPRDGTSTSYDSRSGLPTDTVLGILEDDNGNLWISTLDGLSRFDLRSQKFTNYHTSDGLLTDLFSVPAVATRSPSGEMFFGSHSGLVAFFPDQVIEQKFVAPVVLTTFRLFGEPVQAGTEPLRQPIWSAASLALEARSIFSFDFSALNYVDPVRTRYRYRLEGLEAKWNETDSTRRTVTYTTLPAGHYTFRVQARASRGDWTESGVALPIQILPAWYATWYFRSLCAAVLLTLLWLAYQRRVRQLQQGSRELRDMIETIPAMAWTARSDGSNPFVNRRWAEFTGSSANHSAASAWTDAVHPEDREAYAKTWRASLATGEPFESEARFRSVNGEYRWLLARAVPFRDARGEIVRWYGLLADIADRKLAEAELRASEERFRTLVQFSFDVYWETDAQHRFTRQEYAATLAETPAPGSEIGKTRWEVPYLEPDEEAWRKHRATLDAHAPFRDFDLARPMPGGDKRYVSVSGLPVFDLTGRFLGYRGVGRDVTGRNHAEQALRDSETRFRAFVDHAADAFFMLDFEQGTILDVNRCACESLGYAREELIGLTPLAFDVDLNRATLESIGARAAAGETVLFRRHRHRRKDGALFPVEVQTTVFWHGRRRFLLKVARNISERVQAEEARERLRQLETDLAHINRVSLMGELAASIAHEVNQPLAGIVSNGSACLRWLAGDVPNLEEAREAARRIVRDGKRAGDVIARVRALTRRDAMSAEKLDLNESIQEVLALVGDEAKRQSAIIRTQLANDLAPVAGDRVQLQQVVLNLVLNAIEAMSGVSERARELVITTRNVDADQVQVTVEDTGPGLDPTGMEKVFEPFYTTKASGMGMGLSLSRSIVQSHSGRLWATAKNGPGTGFHFVLPKYPEEERHAGVPEA